MAIVMKIDGWILDRIFDDDELEEARRYERHHNARYQGHMTHFLVREENLAKGLRHYAKAVMSGIPGRGQ